MGPGCRSRGICSAASHSASNRLVLLASCIVRPAQATSTASQLHKLATAMRHGVGYLFSFAEAMASPITGIHMAKSNHSMDMGS